MLIVHSGYTAEYADAITPPRSQKGRTAALGCTARALLWSNSLVTVMTHSGRTPVLCP